MDEPLESDLLAGFSRKDKRELTSWLTRAEFGPGAHILTEGERGNGMYFLREGQVEIQRASTVGTMVVTTLEPGAILGETSLLTHQPCTASAVAKTSVVAELLPALKFDLFLDRSNPTALRFAMNLGRISATRLAQTTRLLVEAVETLGEGRKPDAAKLASWLDKLHLTLARPSARHLEGDGI